MTANFSESNGLDVIMGKVTGGWERLSQLRTSKQVQAFRWQLHGPYIIVWTNRSYYRYKNVFCYRCVLFTCRIVHSVALPVVRRFREGGESATEESSTEERIHLISREDIA